jgi:NDP-sugar pyrophosphorylase family protein
VSTTSLVVPMAGRGSRFSKEGIAEPKPLIDLGGRPFFWWAVESVARETSVGEIIFVVLEEHISQWAIDDRIHAYYPHATVFAISEVTAGSAETANIGMSLLSSDGPVIVNDCDHAFIAHDLQKAIDKLRLEVSGSLMTFRSESANYSYALLALDGSVSGTIEKEAASPFAIAGCYLFSSPALYAEQYKSYADNCPYNELYISGIYNQMILEHISVSKVVLEEHFAFGTPEEYASVQKRLMDNLANWLEG